MALIVGTSSSNTQILAANSSRPASPTAGTIFYNSVNQAMEIYTPTGWTQIGGQLGASQNNPANSAAAIKTATPSATSGLYWIKPTTYSGSAVQLYCDMVYDGGGWTLVFAYHKGQTPVADPSSYYTSPEAAATANSINISTVATPNDPTKSYCLPVEFWQTGTEIREEIAISGGTWPNNTNRVVMYIGGRTSSGTLGNYLSSANMSTARAMMGWNTRGNYGQFGNVCRNGYLSNTLGLETRYASGSNAGGTVLGIQVDASHLGTATTTDGTYSYTNQTGASGSSWMGRGNGYGDQGSSTNGASPNGTRWGLVWVR